ncbi:DUF2207 domain-containing protein [Luteimonas sp. RD2P54]|uniref:DUF2207 domain-containing protein n=1 Tax=Luteimonas endophytica TaxID=3042023 RepID=A0ABT6JCB8_9GAMM|nr:DUF2207 domain-containing protein [Luteimonas endophytica]MDH5824459.1 DUF2207 domain-containing protein [Luteimonas endophytica]
MSAALHRVAGRRAAEVPVPPERRIRGRLPALPPAVALVLGFVMALAASAGAKGAERILAYDSVVEIRADATLEITERIRVRAEGDQIRRGIYRDFPTRYHDRYGNRVTVGFEVIEVLRDGEPEPWFTERRDNGVRVNTGNDDFLPVPAVYTYTLRYRTDRQLGFYEHHDELYWNAIGHGWAFAIDGGSVEARLPQPVPPAEMTASGYTGAQGSRGSDFRSTLPAPGRARWELTGPLAPREGFTIVLEFPKGVVAEPARAQRLLWLLDDNRGLLVGLAGLLVLLAYCAMRWRKVGRDPASGTVVVRYEPPRGYSPGALRYMRRMGHDSRAVTADLLACAVHGAVRIHRDKGLLKDSWRIERTGDLGDATAEPQALLQRLLPRVGSTLEMKNSNASTFQAATGAHQALLKKRFQPAMFKRNAGSIFIAAGIAAGSLVLAFALAAGSGSGVLLLLPVAVLMAVTVVAFAVLVAAPTPAGRRLLDEIEGFRRYLDVAEQQDLERLQGPGDAEPTLDAGRFERLLPYAVALDVEDAWTRRFTLAVGAAAAAATSASIGWYSGGGVGDLGSLTRAVGSSLSSQISSSSTPPGSSSGGGGGGSSGGGGGGGGGGGR